MDHVYCKHGGSLKILSDNGTEFENKLMEEVSKELGVEYKVYSPRYRTFKGKSFFPNVWKRSLNTTH